MGPTIFWNTKWINIVWTWSTWIIFFWIQCPSFFCVFCWVARCHFLGSLSHRWRTNFANWAPLRGPWNAPNPTRSQNGLGPGHGDAGAGCQQDRLWGLGGSNFPQRWAKIWETLWTNFWKTYKEFWRTWERWNNGRIWGLNIGTCWGPCGLGAQTARILQAQLQNIKDWIFEQVDIFPMVFVFNSRTSNDITQKKWAKNGIARLYGLARGPWRAPLHKQMGHSMWGAQKQALVVFCCFFLSKNLK